MSCSIKHEETSRPATCAARVQARSCEVIDRQRFGTPWWDVRALGLDPNFAMAHDLVNCALINEHELTR